MGLFQGFFLGLAAVCFVVFGVTSTATTARAFLRGDENPTLHAPWWALCFAGLGLGCIAIAIPAAIEAQVLLGLPGFFVFMWGWAHARDKAGSADTSMSARRMRASTVPRSERAGGIPASQGGSRLPLWVRQYKPLPPSRPSSPPPVNRSVLRPRDVEADPGPPVHLDAPVALMTAEPVDVPEALPIERAKPSRYDGLRGLLAGVICLSAGIFIRVKADLPVEIGYVACVPLILYGVVRSALSAFTLVRTVAGR